MGISGLKQYFYKMDNHLKAKKNNKKELRNVLSNKRNEKDWTGNKASVFSTLGAIHYAQEEREENDYYATDPKAMELLLAEEEFAPLIWEPACGERHLAKVLEKHGHHVLSTDLIYRGFGAREPINFLQNEIKHFNGDIITNPPYRYAAEFVEKALETIEDKKKVAMFLKLTFLEGKKRRKLFEKNSPKVIYVSSLRLLCAKNGDFQKCTSAAVAYAWFVWEKGFRGDPIVKWIN